jgi:arginyl-tRNA synthetase
MPISPPRCRKIVAATIAMLSIHHQLDQAFRAAIGAAFGLDADPMVGLSQNEKFGDYQSNVAMGLAKIVSDKTGQKTNPRQIAEQIKSHLKLDKIADEITIAGPGFINVKLNSNWLTAQLQQIANDDRLGIPPTTDKQTVVIDYSGPNIAKQMHVGHLRSTIIGDAISRVIEFQGNNVIRQNHIGDWGTQFGMLIAELSGNGSAQIADLEVFYRSAKKHFDDDTDFQNKSRELVVMLQSGDSQIRSAWQQIVEETRRHYQPIYRQLGVLLQTSDERGESFYNGKLADVVNELLKKEIAQKSEGAVVVFVDGRDKSPLIIQKSDGGYLYGTTDLAAIRYRINELHANRIIYTHDSRQAQHFSQVFRTADKASWTRHGEVKLEYAPFGTMLGEDGKPFKSRSGDTIKLIDLLNEAETRALKVVTEKNPELSEEKRNEIAKSIGIGGIKYADLSKDRISDYVFSFDKMLALDGNTAPYLQYAYARIRSIFRKANSEDISKTSLKLESPFELALAKHILRLGEIVDLIARELKPHHLCTYLYELASKFSGFYENCPVLQSEATVRASRLLLCDLTARTMALGLDLLGIEHPEQM